MKTPHTKLNKYKTQQIQNSTDAKLNKCKISKKPLNRYKTQRIQIEQAHASLLLRDSSPSFSFIAAGVRAQPDAL
jgi:hypothetical protein